MPTLFTHAVVAGAANQVCAPKLFATRFLFYSVFCSVVPDADVAAFYLGIPYEHVLGHRGFTHSLTFAFLLAAVVVSTGFPQARILSRLWWKWVAYFFCLTASHGVFDALTDGGHGIAFFAPFDNTRYFLPWRPLPVSPIGASAFFTEYGFRVLFMEIICVWLPAGLIFMAAGRRRVRAARHF